MSLLPSTARGRGGGEVGSESLSVIVPLFDADDLYLQDSLPDEVEQHSETGCVKSKKNNKKIMQDSTPPVAWWRVTIHIIV